MARKDTGAGAGRRVDELMRGVGLRELLQRLGFRRKSGQREVESELERRRRAWVERQERLRDFAVHPYTESELTRRHPAGVNTDVSGSRFNAVEATKAVDLAFEVLQIARNPVSAHGRWIQRWAADHSGFFASVVDLLQSRRDQAPKVP